jgi:hypothetical protein
MKFSHCGEDAFGADLAVRKGSVSLLYHACIPINCDGYEEKGKRG